jgi:hypothetical protein
MSAPAAAPTQPGVAPLQADLLAGVVLEVADLVATRAFYERIFRDAPGTWRETRRSLTFHCPPQTIRFVQRARPRTLADSGQHQAYRVPSGRLRALAADLESAGHQVDWWREDRPPERQLSTYLHDPSGNRVQLMASDEDGLLLDHASVEVHEFDYCEVVYRAALGGQMDYYHAWRVEDFDEARQWAAGDNLCASWTRRDNPSWTDFRDAGRRDSSLRVARPNTQVFWRYGPTVVGLISATKVRQEPPEELIRGTPRLVLRTGQTPEAAVASLSATLPIPFQHQGRSTYVRDPDGNFVELRCAG